MLLLIAIIDLLLSKQKRLKKLIVFFPTKLPDNEYEEIAGLANEGHDDDCVHVTDWDKFWIIYRKIKSGKYNSKQGLLDTTALENDVVSGDFCQLRPGRTLYFLIFCQLRPGRNLLC